MLKKKKVKPFWLISKNLYQIYINITQLKYIIESFNHQFSTAIFDVNGRIYSNTYASLKSEDEINIVMEPNNLSYYITAITVNFVVKNWNIGRNKMIGITTKKDVETAKAITELKNIKIERI